LVVSDHTLLSRHYGHRLLTMLAVKVSVRLLYPLADKRLLVSSGAADDLARISGLSRESFEVVYNPVPETRYPTIPHSIETLWSDAAARIISVGTLKQEKNHELLIR